MMNTLKTSIFALFAIFSISVAQAGDYLTSLDEAKEKAAETGKPILIKFTGSDWCPPCKALNKAVFSKKSFKKAAEKEFVVVVLDFPRKKKLPEGELEANRAVAKEYKIKGYPTVMILTAEGEVVKSQSGYNGLEADAYMADLKKSLDAKSFQ